MSGKLEMGDNPIERIRSCSQDNSALTVGGAKAIYFPLAGNCSMQRDLIMSRNAIINLKPFVKDHSSKDAFNA